MAKSEKENELEQLLKTLPQQDSIAFPGVVEQRVLRIVTIFVKDHLKTIKNLTETIDLSSKIGNKLSKQLLWLNVVLTAVSIIGTLFIVLTFLKQI